MFENLPADITRHVVQKRRRDSTVELDAVLEFSRQVIHLIAPLVPAVKINIAYFEPYYGEGIDGYYALVEEAIRHDLVVIGDVKRGDVGHSAVLYARSHLARPVYHNLPEAAVPHAVTVNGYFGLDGVGPFIELAREHGRGVFVLVRTSNPSAAAIQDIASGSDRRVHTSIAAEVASWAAQPGCVGRSGFSCVGAVVATRDPADAAALRAAMPKCIFLVPGYGAQGGRAEDYVPYFDKRGRGAMIVAGRSVIFAHRRPEYQGRFGADWQRCVEQACQDFIADVSRVLPKRK